VVTFSSGNWGQAVACAAGLLGIRAVVVLPEGANPKKVAAARGYGATVVIYGTNSEHLLDKARELAREQGLVYVNPLDNPDMVAGAASLGLEILDELPDVSAVVVPVGGGALIAGVAAGIKLRNPAVKLYGVQPTGACAVRESLRTGTLVELEQVSTIADGLAVKRPSPDTVSLIGRLVDEIVLVSDEEIRRAVVILLERTKLLVEPSGAASVAGLLSGQIPVAGGPLVAVLTGGNVDFTLLADLVARSAEYRLPDD
jgi:threonine dehydratase